ncbi:hypothetical protein [Streptomyces sp. NBC_00019]|uniref:hypothetical protein n=1 Tax=Streptomyces sp. NBC_00019 TaxID=2975623 RepID=UPI0032522FC5
MSTTVQTFPRTLGEVLASGDAALTNPDVTRTRACTTVAQVLEAEERAAVRRSVDAQFPVVAAFLAAGIEWPTSHSITANLPGDFPWCALGECLEHRCRDGEAFTERSSAQASCGGEGAALDSADAEQVIDNVAEFLEDMRALHTQLLEGASPKVVKWVRDLEAYVEDEPDPRAAYEEVAAAIRSKRPCKTYAWCTERGQHEDHQGAPIAVTVPGETDPYLDARLLSFGPGTESIGFAESDVTPGQARQEAAKLREFADRLEGLAAVVEAGR